MTVSFRDTVRKHGNDLDFSFQGKSKMATMNIRDHVLVNQISFDKVHKKKD